MKVVIIGSGNVATVLGKKILQAGHEIIQVAGRNIDKVQALASFLNTTFTLNLLEINPSSDIYIISVTDAATSEVASKLKLKGKLVVHTSAAVSTGTLSGCSDRYGVLYPLQSIRKELASIPTIPILVDGNSEQTIETIVDFASGWADTVAIANDEERLKLHLAAIFVNNFTNYLFTISARYCESNGLDFKLLKWLIKETISRVEENAPFDLQTGPAIRKDFRTIEKHQELLVDQPEVLQLYNVLTNSIMEFYDKSSNGIEAPSGAR